MWKVTCLVSLFFVGLITLWWMTVFFLSVFIFLADHWKEVPLGDPSASATSQHNGKKTMANLDASHCRYPLRSMQPKEVKLERWEAVGNMHNKMPKKASEMTILGKKKMLPSEKHNWDRFFNPHFTISMLPACVSRNFQLVSCQVKRCCIHWLLVDVQSNGPEGSSAPFLFFL